MRERKVPLKNYCILIVLLLLTIGLTFYLERLYKEKLEYQINQVLVMDNLLQLKEKDIANYVVENHDTMIYVSSNQQDKEINQLMKDFIIQKEYDKDIIYINRDSVSEDFNTSFSDTYYSTVLKEKNIKLTNNPTILILKGGIVSNALEIKEYNFEILSSLIESNYYGVE